VLSSPGIPPSQPPGFLESHEHVEDAWILSRLSYASTAITAGIENFAFQDSINAGYAFAWNELCDWYLEAVKDRLRAGDAVAQDVVYFCLDNIFRLLHPFMPFVTEELWSRLPGPRDYVMRSEWPDLHGRFVDPAAEETFQQVMAIVEEVRGHRQSAGAPPRGGQLLLDGSVSGNVRELAARLAHLELVDELDPGTPLVVVPGRVRFPAGKTGELRTKELERLERDLARLEERLANPEFREKAPESVVADIEQRRDALKAAIERLKLE
jgi:valyl-tRNA synthetase